ncbi:glycine--tRNA ligase [Mycoplasmopsis arginini]|uniref:glycine--tRNA ligase n=1 Tax=Mycoplasmopsis arginini TaxID=2094 RepID=A0ABZ2AN89_MYCAR|nr:glycine--tRNA ligase [Mycoplasmopsis arginini]MDP4042884.1 glycine--tRNA ligase [Mycoplasmopsis arginini]PWC09087.1 glycine--tRNA ligase [Mycoplasmopsis arginini]WVN22222.1 glycine--tRNA ligase [Mycoplasmopsis arginini]VEU81629.1 Glycine--tRNA ligase [Mycoplasmopsis arginini]
MSNDNQKNIQDVIAHLKNQGFVYQNSEIYGGVVNTWDYGPLATTMMTQIKNIWINEFIRKEKNYQIDSKIIMNKNVWKASGHIDNFSDFLIENKVNNKRYRADHIVKDLFPEINVEKCTFEDLEKIIKENVNKYDGVATDWGVIRPFNLMFKTQMGAIDNASSETFLRPETAQGIFINFKNLTRTSRAKLPFGIGQIGKSFRNEITPRDFIFRTREFEQMELEFFCEEKDSDKFYEYWINKCKNLVTFLGLKEDNIRIRPHEKEELSHYSKGTSDIEYLFPFGWGELLGIANRGNYDLSQHMKFSGESLEYLKEDGTKIIPFVIEPSIGLDRLLFALIIDAFDIEKLDNQEERVVLHLDQKISPYQIAILPLMKKQSDEAKKIFEDLIENTNLRVTYDESGSIGKRYRRQDAIGTPFCVTIDFDTVEHNTVTIRNRDTMKQDTILVSDIAKYLEDQKK